MHTTKTDPCVSAPTEDEGMAFWQPPAVGTPIDTSHEFPTARALQAAEEAQANDYGNPRLAEVVRLLREQRGLELAARRAKLREEML